MTIKELNIFYPSTKQLYNRKTISFKPYFSYIIIFHHIYNFN